MTSVELLPVQMFVDKPPYLAEKDLSNYWGYDTLGFFALHSQLIWPRPSIDEFKQMVDRYHAARPRDHP